MKIAIPNFRLNLILFCLFFEKCGTQEDTDSFCKPVEKAICINADAFNNNYDLFKAILHESIHLISFDKYHLDKNSKSIKTYRSGYRNIPLNKDLYEHFQGFNEAITEKIAIDVLKKHQNLITDKLNISET